MPPRYIVRPNRIGKTPRELKRQLGAQRTVPISSERDVDYSRDILLACPPVHKVANAPSDYPLVRQVYYRNKRDQRQALSRLDLPVISTLGRDGQWFGERYPTPTLTYIRRPLWHRGGRSFEHLEHLPVVNHSQHYISQFIPKQKEFRVLYFMGERVCTYLKQTNQPSVSVESPWNFLNGYRFLTIYNEQNDLLRNTELYNKLDNSPLVQSAHMLAFDILWLNSVALICEVNFCPGITIQNTFNRIKSIYEVRQNN